MSLLKSSKHTCVSPAELAPQRCIFRTCLKTCSRKSKMESVVKYCVYLDILFMGSIYLLKSTCLRGNPISGQKIFESTAQLSLGEGYSQEKHHQTARDPHRIAEKHLRSEHLYVQSTLQRATSCPTLEPRASWQI